MRERLLRDIGPTAAADGGDLLLMFYAQSLSRGPLVADPPATKASAEMVRPDFRRAAGAIERAE